MPILRRFLGLLPGATPVAVEFQPLSTSDRAKIEARLKRDPVCAPPDSIVGALDAGRQHFRNDYERVLEEVKRRCSASEIWQNFYLDLLDADGRNEDGEAGIGADPVEPDEELRRLLAGVQVFPDVRPRFAWELGYHTLRYALARPRDPQMHLYAAKSAAEDFLLAYHEAKDVESRVNALGDLAGALFVEGNTAEAQQLCDYAAAAISADEAVRQELHRLRREGLPFVQESYGA